MQVGSIGLVTLRAIPSDGELAWGSMLLSAAPGERSTGSKNVSPSLANTTLYVGVCIFCMALWRLVARTVQVYPVSGEMRNHKQRAYTYMYTYNRLSCSGSRTLHMHNTKICFEESFCVKKKQGND